MNTKLLIGTLFVVVASAIAVASPSNTYAKEICFTQYGGGETCIVVDESNIDVDKEVYNPESGEYEDHVRSSGGSYPYTFGADEIIKFKIKVENIDEDKLIDVELKDTLPSFVTYESGDGDDEKDGTEVNFDVGDLEKGESKTFYFKAKIADDEVLPKDDRICLTNIVKAEGRGVDGGSDEKKDVDYANFCIELPKVKGKESPTQLPVTGGREDATKILLVSTAVGFVLLGYGLKKIAD